MSGHETDASVERGFGSLENIVRPFDTWDTFAFLTAFVLLAFHPAPRVSKGILQLLLLLVLVWPAARRHRLTWLAIGSVVFVTAARSWEITNNHDLLWAYWCLALGFSATQADRREVLGRSARVLLGLVFALAVLWKLLAPDFVSGDAVEWMLLTDPRFGGVAETVGGLAPADQAQNTQRMLDLTSWHADATSVDLLSSPRIRTVAVAVTVWALLAESAMALSFLTPLRRYQVGSWLLVVFVATTYTAVPVYRFGAILALLGLAQTDDSTPVLRSALIGAFVLMPITHALPQFPFG